MFKLCVKVFLYYGYYCTLLCLLIERQKQPATLLKRRLWHMCFPVNFVKFLKATFLQNTSGRLLLERDSLLHEVQHFHHFQKQPQDAFYKKAALKNFSIFTGKHLCWSLFFIKLQTLGLQLYQKGSPTQAFSY